MLWVWCAAGGVQVRRAGAVRPRGRPRAPFSGLRAARARPLQLPLPLVAISSRSGRVAESEGRGSGLGCGVREGQRGGEVLGAWPAQIGGADWGRCRAEGRVRGPGRHGLAGRRGPGRGLAPRGGEGSAARVGARWRGPVSGRREGEGSAGGRGRCPGSAGVRVQRRCLLPARGRAGWDAVFWGGGRGALSRRRPGAMRRSSTDESTYRRSPSPEGKEPGFARGGPFRRYSSLYRRAGAGDGGDSGGGGPFFGLHASPGPKATQTRYTSPKGNKYVVFYLDLSFIFLLELKRCSMARGCLQGVKYLMFAFNLLFWVSGRSCRGGAGDCPGSLLRLRARAAPARGGWFRDRGVLQPLRSRGPPRLLSRSRLFLRPRVSRTCTPRGEAPALRLACAGLRVQRCAETPGPPCVPSRPSPSSARPASFLCRRLLQSAPTYQPQRLRFQRGCWGRSGPPVSGGGVGKEGHSERPGCAGTEQARGPPRVSGPPTLSPTWWWCGCSHGLGLFRQETLVSRVLGVGSAG